MKAKIKPVKDRTDLNLLELVCQLHARSLRAGTKEMHEASREARVELENRLKVYAQSKPIVTDRLQEQSAKEFLRARGIHSETVFADINEKRIATLGELLSEFAESYAQSLNKLGNISDEQIEKCASGYFAGLEGNLVERVNLEKAWTKGAKWLRDQIQKPDNEWEEEFPKDF